ncbi:MAG: heme o synthase [Chloroflexota bacterium]
MATITTTTAAAARDIRGVLSAYVRLTKPRIVSLLVITTLPAMILAEGGLPSVWLMFATVFGGSVVAGGANAMNMYFDRDIDEIMYRTRVRPIPSHAVEPERAALFGLVLGGAGFAFLNIFVNPLAAALTLAAFVFYVVVYTLILKRNTSWNIVIGGAAGAMPPMIGWAAVTNSVSIEAILMFAIVTLWTPPHFWALSINYSSDYKRAGIPMLPVVSGIDETKRQIFGYTFVLVASTIALALVSDLGVIYFASAVVLGAGFIYYAAKLFRTGTVKDALGVFRYSIAYLALLFGAIALDVLVRG